MSRVAALERPSPLLDAAKDIMGPALAVAGGAVTDWAGPLLPGEREDVARASPLRLQEFAAGRTAARRAMTLLGYSPVPLRRSPKGPVIWPEGLTGSVSHGGGFVLAALGRTGPGLSAIGIDLEPYVQLPRELAQEVCRPEEDGSEAIRIFSAKEAAYKAQFPLTGLLIDFMALRVTFGPRQRFWAEFTHPVGGFGPKDVLMGHQVLIGPILLSVVRISGDEARH